MHELHSARPLPADTEITLRYPDVSEALCLDTAFQAQEVKDRIGATVMAALRIAVPAGVRPIEAWLSAMAAENRLPDTRPVHPALLAALEADPAAWRFFYALI